MLDALFYTGLGIFFAFAIGLNVLVVVLEMRDR